MLRTILSALCVACCFIAFSQNISGIVNTYYKVTAVNTPTYVTVSNAAGLAPLDRVMIVQMKGATINTTNTSSFGTPAINTAGNYELATICKIQGNDVYFVNTISRTYDVAGKVQLVKIPQYTSAAVNTLLEPAPWNNSTGTGGVLAISVSGTLTLNANISADGKGFKGGAFLMSGGDCVDNVADSFYHYPNLVDYRYIFINLNDIQMGGFKGESIAEILVKYQGGRGATANGGGGGNNHNTGAGGGSNAGAGGKGGNNTSQGSNCSSDYEGIGGYSLNDATKIFLGGGGGAGHGNNTAQTGGGSGGGIIYLEAASIITNGYKVSANGTAGSNTQGDGGSGGGAGGTIVIKSSIDNGAAISANGGKGGQVDNEGYPDRCMGDGGGGGGGAVYFTSTSPSGVSVSGGSAGGKIMSPGCSTASPGENGANGKVVGSYTIQQSTTETACAAAISLPVQLISFKAFLQNKKVSIEWEVTDPQDADHYTIQRKGTAEDWKEITTIKGDAKAAVYQSTDATVAEGDYMYRLKIIEKDGNIIYSPVRYVSFNNQSARLAIFPNPVTSMQDVTLQYNFKAGDVIKVFDAAGRLVLQKQLKKDESVVNLNLSGLQKGMYMIVAANATGRIMVQ